MARSDVMKGLTTGLSVMVALGLIAGLFVSLLGFVGHWPADLIAPFRPQLLILATAAVLVSVALRSRWLIALAAAEVLLNAAPVAYRLLSRPVLPAHSPAPSKSVSVVFSNVLCDNRHFDKVIALAEGQDTDIFAAAETTPEWIGHLSAIEGRYPYHLASEDEGVFGVALYAKRPFKGEVLDVGSRGMPLLRADFGDYVVYVAHPLPPINIALSEDNLGYLQDLTARVSLESRPVIVVGDFNSTLWSHSMGPVITGRLQWPSGSGMAYSWPTANPLLGIQIDHVLTKGAVAGAYRALPSVESDHFPVRGDIALPAT